MDLHTLEERIKLVEMTLCSLKIHRNSLVHRHILFEAFRNGPEATPEAVTQEESDFKKVKIKWRKDFILKVEMVENQLKLLAGYPQSHQRDESLKSLTEKLKETLVDFAPKLAENAA